MLFFENFSILPIMENIIEPNDLFDFSKLSLTHPISIQGGAFFTKIQHQEKPLYIQTTKSLTRQGIVKTGKKYYSDLMFDHFSEPLIHWFERLEEKCHQLIYEKSDTWFQHALEMNDVESAFNSIIRIYKSGKFYLVRCNIKSSSLTNDPVIKIYNENEIPLSFSDITNETNIISILEIQGIKFTARNFQIEIELKQMMVLDNEPIFDSCLIKTSKKVDKTSLVANLEPEPLEKGESEEPLENLLENLEPVVDPPVTTDDLITTTIDSTTINQTNPLSVDQTTESLDLIIENLAVEEEEAKELSEVVDLSLENDLETMTLKKPNQVYFELYKEARNKAKEAKKSLILAYLEAKNIKKTYMLDNLDHQSDDDSDLDAEIDEMSESELEGL